LSTPPRSGKIGDLVSSHDAMALRPGPPPALGDSGAQSWPSKRSNNDAQITVAGSDASAGAHAAPDELTPGTTVGRYMILSRLGSGAMGVVYAAYDPELDRKVALKLLHPRGGSSLDSRVRLMREAKALARLSHPNVVAVHDVGTFAERVFLAMEFVDGKTLSAWLKDQVSPRPWPEVLALLRDAGAGLAAAHAAGLIHRDFKPDNVLIARDGRVRVLDFGLARSAGEAAPEDPESDPAAAAVLASVSSERRERSQIEDALLTRTGALVGTPAYMSPEQHLGRYADPRSDQFSFCVALYQALYGVRPFVGERMSSLAFQVLQGKIGGVPAGSTVPTWLRRIVVRGLSVDPELRYPGMPDLLADLDRESGGGKRRRTGLLVGGGALLGLAALLGLRAAAPAPEQPCRGAADRLAGVWDAPRAAELEQVFRGSSLPYAAATWTSLRPGLDAYASAWTAAHTDACEATRVRGEQSEHLLDLRMHCLDRRRVELGALTDVLLRGEPGAIEKASEGLARLGEVATCDDTATLDAVVEPPTGKLKVEVDRVAADIARASALELAGRWPDAERLTAAAIADPAVQAYPPLAAEALRVHARLQQLLGAPADAATSLLTAVDAAVRGRDDRSAAEAWTDLVFVTGFHLNQAEAAAAYTRAAAAAVVRAGADPLLRARLDADISSVQVRLGDAEQGLAAGQRALEYFDANLEADPARLHRLLGNLALIHKHRKEFDAARAELQRALELVRRESGKDHPSAATLLTTLGALALDEGRLDEAREHADEAAAIRRRALPPDHLDFASSEELFAGVAEARGETATAAAHFRRALEIYQAGPHPSPTKLAALHNNMAGLAVDEGRLADAVTDYRSALAGFRAVSDDNDYAITVEENLAQTLLAQGDAAAARPLQQHVLAVLQRRLSDDDPDLAAARVQHAQILRALAEPAAARELLGEAVAALERAPADYRGQLGLARYTLARCLADLRLDRPAQRQLAALAAADLATDDDAASRRALAELRTWNPR
jgi:eukaryotic-like serine/threonine-protein kinase